MDSFSNLGLEQLINEPTHVRGNILDIVLTDKPQLVLNISVSDAVPPCKSDHFPICFNIKSKIRKRQSAKREIYNYKHADWESLIHDIRSVPWDSELHGDMEHAWYSFKKILFTFVDKHIPKIKVNGSSQPIWFDAETHSLCREKERLHKRWKDTDSNNLDLKKERYLKFSNCRRKFKNLVKQKMRDNFEDEDDHNLITKKFWSFVKASSNSLRIPELIHLVVFIGLIHWNSLSSLMIISILSFLNLAFMILMLICMRRVHWVQL